MSHKETEKVPSTDWMSEDQNQLNAVEWFGCIFFYLINLGKIPFNRLYSQKYHRRNMWVGYFIQLTVVFGVIALLIYIY